MAAETQYTARTGMATCPINTNLNGSTGDYETVITAGSNGTLIKTVTFKARAGTYTEILRLFVYEHNSADTRLIWEMKVPTIEKTSRNPCMEIVVPINYFLEANCILKATAQTSAIINVFAEGLDWGYYGSVRPESTKYTAHTEMAVVDTANTSMTGAAGSIVDCFTAATPGSIIQSITIKSSVNTTPGMIRLFLYDGTYTKLFKEIPVGYKTKSAIAHSFSHRIDFDGRDFALNYNWKIKATTEISETFNIIVEALDWSYPA